MAGQGPSMDPQTYARIRQVSAFSTYPVNLKQLPGMANVAQVFGAEWFSVRFYSWKDSTR